MKPALSFQDPEKTIRVVVLSRLDYCNALFTPLSQGFYGPLPVHPLTSSTVYGSHCDTGLFKQTTSEVINQFFKIFINCSGHDPNYTASLNDCAH